jgi:hypothetical protein
LRDWEPLREDFKESNRQQADAIAAMLETVGCVVERPKEGTLSTVLSDAEVEHLAQLEHARWTAERLAQGWRHSPVKDRDKKLHSDLVAWEDLSEESRDSDRDAVAAWRELLAELGLEIHRQ